MGWVDEKEQDSVQDRMYTPKFLALRGSSLFKFSAPPVSAYSDVFVLFYRHLHHRNSSFHNNSCHYCFPCLGGGGGSAHSLVIVAYYVSNNYLYPA